MTLLTRLFPLWAVLLSAVALAFPAHFTAAQPAVVPLLALVMLGMGLTLTAGDFRGVLAMPRLVATGVALQFSVMPLAAVAVSGLLALPPEQRLGMVLVGAVSGGTASNVITYLARGNVALSVTMTAVSTLLAVVVTPAWTLVLAGKAMPVPLAGLVQTLALAVVLHNGLGLAAGYGLSRLLGAGRREARTIAIEVGMQKSGLAVALALKFFTPVAALPGAIFGLWHNLSGAMLASWWASRPPPGRAETR